MAIKVNEADAVLKAAAAVMNEHKDMNVRMVWDTFNPRNNDIDFWVGVIATAHKRDVFTKEGMIHILLALQAKGAKSKHFNQLVKDVLT